MENKIYKHQLKNSPKEKCPSCGEKTLATYTNTNNKTDGKCDREVMCGYKKIPD